MNGIRNAARTPIRRPLAGWVESIVNVVAIGALSLVYAVGHALGAHPIAFILYAMPAAACGMLVLSGPVEIARHPLSWVIGGSVILIEVFYFVTLTYVSPAHGNLVLRISVPLAMAAGFLVHRRGQPRRAVAGGVAIVAVIGFVGAITPAGVRGPMMIAGLLAGAFMVVRAFAAEFHPLNRAAKTVSEKLRFTGTVVLITSVMSLAGIGALAALVASGIVPPVRFLPSAAAMLDVPAILLGTLAGGAVLATMAYMSFSAVVRITSESFMSILAFSPVTTWAFQEIGVALGLIAVPRPDAPLVAAMGAIIAAVLLILWSNRRAGPR